MVGTRMGGFKFHVVGVSHSCGQSRVNDRRCLGLCHIIAVFLLQIARELLVPTVGVCSSY